MKKGMITVAICYIAWGVLTIYWKLLGVVICINWGSYIIAVQTGHIVQSSLGYYINPLLVILLSTICFHEKLHKLECVSIILAATGVVILVISSGEIPYLALIIGGSFAIYGAIKKAANIESEVSLAIETATAFPFAIIFVIASEVHGVGAIGYLHGWQFILLPLAGIITSVPLLLFG